MRRVTAITVNYNSGSDCARLLTELGNQEGIHDLDVVVIDSASEDGSLDGAKVAAQELQSRMQINFVEPGRNVGYTGSNLGIPAQDGPVFLVNPDVRLHSPSTLAVLIDLLLSDASLAAVAPTIVTDGRIEYSDSVVDPLSARAEHRGTHRDTWPHPEPTVDLSWVNGAAWLLGANAIRSVGPLDERFFLFFEETDWCLRARRAGFRVALTHRASVGHIRSSSFGGSTKGAYYYWRNLYLLLRKHGQGLPWRLAYARRLLRFLAAARSWRSGQATRALEGLADALRESFGPAREDKPRPGRRTPRA